MSSGFFGIEQPVRYEGPDSANPLAFRWYQPDRMVLGKRMEDHLRFAVCYWHSFCWPGTDRLGGPTLERPWMEPGEPMAMARRNAEVAFEMCRLLEGSRDIPGGRKGAAARGSGVRPGRQAPRASARHRAPPGPPRWPSSRLVNRFV